MVRLVAIFCLLAYLVVYIILRRMRGSARRILNSRVGGR